VKLDEHLAAENAHSLERIMATYVANPLIVLNGQRIEGVEAVRAFHRSFGFSNEGSFSNVHVAERHRHIAADGTVIVEQTLSGTHTGAWQGLASTGRTFSLDVCTVYSFEGEQLASERVYMDLAWLRRQLTR
jgi:limonene-1,2-epoxide hydrolase